MYFHLYMFSLKKHCVKFAHYCIWMKCYDTQHSWMKGIHSYFGIFKCFTWIPVTYYFVQARLVSVISTLTDVLKWKLREKIYREGRTPVEYEEVMTTNKTPCSFTTYACPLLTPSLSAVSLTFLLNPLVAFQMRNNITIGSAISSRFVIHFKQPTPHLHVFNDQLAEDTNHLWSNDIKILHYDNIKLFLNSDFQFLDIWTWNLFSKYGFFFLETPVSLQLSRTHSESILECFLLKNPWSSAYTWVHLCRLPNSNWAPLAVGEAVFCREKIACPGFFCLIMILSFG